MNPARWYAQNWSTSPTPSLSTMQIVYRVLNKFLLHLRIFELGSYSSKRKFQRFTSFVFCLYVCLFLKKDRCFISLNDPCHLFIFRFFLNDTMFTKKIRSFRKTISRLSKYWVQWHFFTSTWSTLNIAGIFLWTIHEVHWVYRSFLLRTST